MQVGDGIEDALDDPQFLQGGQPFLHHRGSPPHAGIAVAGLESRLLLAEAMRPVDQPFPEHPFVQGEAHRGGAGLDLDVVEILLRVQPAHTRQIEAAVVLQVGVGGSVGILVGLLEPLGPVVEEIGVQILDVPLAPAFLLASALISHGFS